METMILDGYVAELTVDTEVGVITGSVVNTRAVLTFTSESVAGLKAAFADTIADYISWCAEREVAPEKPYSGTVSLRLTPARHREVASAAAIAGESINSFIVSAVETRLSGAPASTSHMTVEPRAAIRAMYKIPAHGMTVGVYSATVSEEHDADQPLNVPYLVAQSSMARA